MIQVVLTFVVRCRRCFVLVVVVVVERGGLLLGAVAAHDALADRHSLVEPRVVHLPQCYLSSQ